METDTEHLGHRINEHVRKCMDYEKGNLMAYTILMKRAHDMLLAGADEKSVIDEISNLTQPIEKWK